MHYGLYIQRRNGKGEEILVSQENNNYTSLCGSIISSVMTSSSFLSLAISGISSFLSILFQTRACLSENMLVKNMMETRPKYMAKVKN